MSNVLTFSGHLGQDCERRYTPSNMAVLNFSVAMSSGYGDKKKTDWVRVEVWGKPAEGSLKDYLKKGQCVMVSGECHVETYQANDGTIKANIRLNANLVELVGKKSD